MYLTLCAPEALAAVISTPVLCKFNMSNAVISSGCFFNKSAAAFLLNKVLPANRDLFLNQADNASGVFISDKPEDLNTSSPILGLMASIIPFTVSSGK